jgi:hypothetical protein
MHHCVKCFVESNNVKTKIMSMLYIYFDGQLFPVFSMFTMRMLCQSVIGEVGFLNPT